MATKKLTSEQIAVCDCEAQTIMVDAGAGTGKTSTLVAFAETNGDDSILYVAFNKSIQMEAAGRFPSNTKCRTGHSIAYSVCGRDYGNAPNKLQGDMKPFHIQRQIMRSTNDIPVSAHNLYGGRVIETVKNFLVSADAEMTRNHVSIGNAPVETKYFEENRILADAKHIWGLMQDLKSDVPMLHDGYLKMYQLSGRKLPYDIILFDEAQDTNPVMQAIVGSQQGGKVYEVADIANHILAAKQEAMRLRGLGPESRVRSIGASEGYAYISRGNVALFNKAVHCLSSDQPFSFVGEIKGYRFDQILDVYNLSVGNQVKDPFIRSFAGFDELAEYADMINDREVKSRCKVVTKYGNDIPRLIEQIEKKALPPVVSNEETSGKKRIVLTTGHKSKGLEFPNVQMAGDFMELIDEEGKVFDIAEASDQDIEEVNIQYVTATRAQKALQLCESLETYLEHVREYGTEADRRPKMA